MQKILIVHNTYRNQGGEDIAVLREIKLLKNFFEVETLFFENKIENYLSQLISFLISSNKKNNKKLKQCLTQFKPDHVYVHNTWFSASLGLFKILEKEKINTLVKLHNFRYHCTRSFRSTDHISKGASCSACGFNKSNHRLFNKYFEESYIKSFFVNLYGRRYVKVLKKDSISLLVLTEFHKKFLEKNNYKAEKLHIFPNYINPELNAKVNRGRYFVYAGRISIEKGVDELISAFLSSNLRNYDLKVIGNGPYLKVLKEKYTNNNIQFLGEMENSEVIEIIANSRAVLTATKLFEGQPTLLCEASNLGVPSLFPDTGGISEFFPKGYDLTFEQFNYKDLVNKLNKLANEELLVKRGVEVKKFIEENFNQDKIVKKMKEILNEK